MDPAGATEISSVQPACFEEAKVGSGAQIGGIIGVQGTSIQTSPLSASQGQDVDNSLIQLLVPGTYQLSLSPTRTILISGEDGAGSRDHEGLSQNFIPLPSAGDILIPRTGEEMVDFSALGSPISQGAPSQNRLSLRSVSREQITADRVEGIRVVEVDLVRREAGSESVPKWVLDHIADFAKFLGLSFEGLDTSNIARDNLEIGDIIMELQFSPSNNILLEFLITFVYQDDTNSESRVWYYGGWAAPDIYFLGFSGVIKFGNIRIGGLSGIYNARHYHCGHYERSPYNESDIRSVYHVREYDVHKLMQVEEPIDIFLSHDWPLGITDFGNWKELVRHKPYFEKEVQEKTLGSKAAAELLDKLKPPYWFSAHLHCKFAALVQHGEGGPVTKFLALDKCLPRRKFLQIVDIKTEPGPYEIQYDEEWLAITRKFNSVFPLTSKRVQLGDVQLDMKDCRQWVRSRLKTRGAKPFDFARTVPCYDPVQTVSDTFYGHHRNPQTDALLQLLELPYLLDNTLESKALSNSMGQLVSFNMTRLLILIIDASEGAFDDDSEDAAIDDVDEIEEFAEVADVNRA
ncbi:hypothetical protein HHK36_030814 [Tetracentron sinense]|uniref:Lariat debranching enzyme C-terminal domain-containing protein n=1 Tax=Tetracentron sinense TaxID=13715 RepID=A0A835CYM6_TETSI|nr:hypothetical protein HHK36_030814 [Tetracentron sinense]